MMTSNRTMIPADAYIAEMQKAASTHTPEELDWVNKTLLEDQLIDFPTYNAIADGLASNRVWGVPIHFYTPEEIADRSRFFGLIDAYIDEYPEDCLEYDGPVKMHEELGWTQVLTNGDDSFQAILVDGDVVFFPYHG